MALATTNFEVGLVQLAIQNGSVYSAQRPVAPTFAMLLGKDAEMQDNIISNVKGVPTYGALSDAEIRSGIIRSFVGNNTTLGTDTTRANQTATISTFTPQEVITDLAIRTTYYNDGGQFINVARMVEGQGAGWAANQSYEQVLAAQMVQEYITKRDARLFASGAGTMPADGSFGSLRAMISDGLSIANRGGIGTDEATNYGTYAGQTRTTPGSIYASQYVWAPGTGTTALSESIAANAALRGYGAGAGKLVAPMSLARFAAFELALRQQYGQIRIDEEMKLLVNGGRCIEFAGVTWFPDPNVPAAQWQLLVDLGTPGMPNTIARTAMQKSLIQHVPAANLNAADRLRWVFPDQVFVRNPRACVLIEGLNTI
jgi:hypothetical protein